MSQFKILIVEDDPNMNRGLVHVLKKQGYAVFSVDCGEKALESIRQNSLDLIVSDFKLPEWTAVRSLMPLKTLTRA